MTETDVVILAGADNHGPLKECADEPYEALISINGHPMVEYVVQAVLRSRYVKRVVVVGPKEELEPVVGPQVYKVVERGRDMVENILLGIEALQPITGKVLLVTSDIPLISPEAIDDFLERCTSHQADVYYPIVRREANEEKYPGVRRTYVHLKEGVFTGGNMALLDPDVIRRCYQTIEQAVIMRKKPLQLSRLLGVKFIVKLLLRRLSIHEIEDRVHHKLGFVGRGIISPYPEVGIDVDKPSDLDLARQVCRPTAG